MEIYRSLDTPASKEFEKLLNNEFSKTNNIKEGKIIEATITKVTSKMVFCEIASAKSEAVIELNEFKILGMLDKAKEKNKIRVYLERIESAKDGQIVVNLSRAVKQEGFLKLVKAYEDKKQITGRIIARCKGGVVVEHADTKIHGFMPGSQISDKKITDLTSVMNEPLKFIIIKIDLERGNYCVSRRQVISEHKAVDKKKILNNFEVGQIVEGVAKGFSSFGAFFSVETPDGPLDVLCHLMECSWTKITHPEDLINLNSKYRLKVISKDMDKLQCGVSIKALTDDPFLKINEYPLNTPIKGRVTKIVEFGAFVTFGKNLEALLHNSQISHKKNDTAKKILKVNDTVTVCIQSIDKDKRHVAVSRKATITNPYETFLKAHPIGSICSGVVSNCNDYSIFIQPDNFKDIEVFNHCRDIDYLSEPEEILKTYKKGTKVESFKVMDVKIEEQKIRGSIKECQIDPMGLFFEKNKTAVNDILTCTVISSDSKSGLIVKPEKCQMSFQIQKKELAINSQDQRVGRWIKGDRLDVAIKEISPSKRKVVLSIKLLEELNNAKALKAGNDPLSGRQLPFTQLSDKLKKKQKE